MFESTLNQRVTYGGLAVYRPGFARNNGTCPTPYGKIGNLATQSLILLLNEIKRQHQRLNLILTGFTPVVPNLVKTH